MSAGATLLRWKAVKAWLLLAWTLGVLLLSARGHAHTSATTYFQVVVDEERLRVGVRADAAGAVELIRGENLNRRVTAAEVSAIWPAFEARFRERFVVVGGAVTCEPRPAQTYRFDEEKQQLHFGFVADCAGYRWPLSATLTPFLKAPTLHNFSGHFFQGDCVQLYFFTRRVEAVPIEQGRLVCGRKKPALLEGLPPAGVALAPPALKPVAGGPGRGAGFYVAEYFPIGIEHILTGWDHLLFVLALILGVAVGRDSDRPQLEALRRIVPIITAFTVAHSITLALAIFVVLPIPSIAVEIVIAASIAVMAADNIVREQKRERFILTFAFGLIHGLGFSGFLREQLQGQEGVGWSLLAFNLGVEVGQLLFVLPLVPLLALLRSRLAPSQALRRGLIAANGAVGLVAVYWTVERVLG